MREVAEVRVTVDDEYLRARVRHHAAEIRAAVVAEVLTALRDEGQAFAECGWHTLGENYAQAVDFLAKRFASTPDREATGEAP